VKIDQELVEQIKILIALHGGGNVKRQVNAQVRKGTADFLSAVWFLMWIFVGALGTWLLFILIAATTHFLG
jgi:hypothetical protein